MSTVDDLPWPELGNVSRGATRGNQGQKGVLGPPDRDGRCVLQLRVQPGVLAVRLNRQASDWYRSLDNEVNRALKLTKTYWRKARRRQDYDARADQDHMELHEWLQQLKDKTMSHLELLMQKGDIQGPPYTMPDDIELSFLRKFIERQASGIPHNPRLRNAEGHSSMSLRGNSVDSVTPEPSEQDFLDAGQRMGLEHLSSASSAHFTSSSRFSGSPSSCSPESLAQEASSSKQALQVARGSLSRAQKDTQDAFLRYTSYLDIERQARQAVVAAERRRDDIMAILLSRNQTTTTGAHSLSAMYCTASYFSDVESPSRRSSLSEDESRSPSRYHAEDIRDAFDHSRATTRTMEWSDPDAHVHSVYPSEPVAHHEDYSAKSNRKHIRTWDSGPQLQDDQYSCEDMTTLPPRKRLHHMMPNFHVLNTPAALHPQNMVFHS